MSASRPGRRGGEFGAALEPCGPLRHGCRPLRTTRHNERRPVPTIQMPVGLVIAEEPLRLGVEGELAIEAIDAIGDMGELADRN